MSDRNLSYSFVNEESGVTICHEMVYTTSNGYWRGEDPLTTSLGSFTMQIITILVITQFLYYIFKPLKQSRFVVEIIAGIIMGRSVLKRFKRWEDSVLPIWMDNLIRTIGYLGMSLLIFLSSVKMNPRIIFTSGKRTIVIAFIAMVLTILVATGTVVVASRKVPDRILHGTFVVFIPATVALTGFPNVALVLAEYGLLNSELGQLSLNTSLIHDYFGWFFMALFAGVGQGQIQPLTTLWSMLLLVALIMIVIFIFRPWMKWIVRRVPMGGHIGEEYLTAILLSALVLGLLSDAIGCTIAIGPMILGLATPNGPPLGSALVDRAELIVMEVFLPMLFITSGMTTDLSVLVPPKVNQYAPLYVVFLVGFATKFIGIFVPSLFFDMKLKNSVVFGLMMNIKGFIEVMVFQILWSGGLLEDEGYSVAILCTTFLMILLTPVMVYLYDPLENVVSVFDRRTISQVRSSDMLRVLICVHNEDPVPYMINLLDMFNVTDPKVTIDVYMINLVELQGRAIPMLIRHNSEKDAKDPVTKAFKNYSNRTNGLVRVKMYTTISPYRSMHIDVRKIAEENLVSVVIFSFCKKGKIGKADHAMRTMTPTVLDNSSCSVGILIHDVPIYSRPMHHVGVIFWGGPDDRDALAFATYIANREGVTVTVHRYMHTQTQSQSQTQTEHNVAVDELLETRMDDEAVTEFKTRTIRPDNADSKKVTVIESMLDDPMQIVEQITSFGQNYDLLIVGHTQRALSNVMTEWSDRPELGVFGDMLASTTLKICPVLVLHCNQRETT